MGIMTDKESIYEKAKLLAPIDRLQLVDAILESLDKPNPEIEKFWVKESDARYEAFRRGELKATEWEEIKNKFE